MGRKQIQNGRLKKKQLFSKLPIFLSYVGQPHNHIGWAKSILLTQGPIHEIFIKKNWELAMLKKVVFLTRPFWFFFWKIYTFFCFFSYGNKSKFIGKDGSSQSDGTFWPRPNIWRGLYLKFNCVLCKKWIPVHIVYTTLIGKHYQHPISVYGSCSLGRFLS